MWITLTNTETHREIDVNTDTIRYMEDYISEAFGHQGTMLTVDYNRGIFLFVKETRAQIRALMEK
jgi:hypothetical protein